MINAAGGPGHAKAIALAFVALSVLFLALITMPQPIAHKGSVRDRLDFMSRLAGLPDAHLLDDGVRPCND
jgi:hypothetical protein